MNLEEGEIAESDEDQLNEGQFSRGRIKRRRSSSSSEEMFRPTERPGYREMFRDESFEARRPRTPKGSEIAIGAGHSQETPTTAQ